MTELPTIIKELDFVKTHKYLEFIAELENRITEAGYNVVEKNIDKPWGAYLRLDSRQADDFVRDFFPDLSPDEARLGIYGAELSPKFLIVKPDQRLSWQYHDRRAERWCFLTTGAYRRSMTNRESARIEADAGEFVQFHTAERHRLEGQPGGFVLVAEIWQHSDLDYPSDEEDIVRLADDYSR